MTTAPLRRDAARNRDGILAAARSLAREGLPLQLNAVARRADVGVGTVYRHFPTTEALVETLVEGRFDDLTQRATAAAGEVDAAGALRGFLALAMRVYVDDVAFAGVATASHPALDTTKAKRRALLDAFAVLLERVGAASHLRSPLGAQDAMALVCGASYAVRVSGTKAPDTYLAALLDGLLVVADE